MSESERTEYMQLLKNSLHQPLSDAARAASTRLLSVIRALRIAQWRIDDWRVAERRRAWGAPAGARDRAARAADSARRDVMRPEYDLRGGVRGKYAGRSTVTIAPSPFVMLSTTTSGGGHLVEKPGAT